MIIGATPETDYQIVRVAQSLYDNFDLKRVFYSAFVHVNDDAAPACQDRRRAAASQGTPAVSGRTGCSGIITSGQKNFCLRSSPNFNIHFDPKCNWALNHLEQFPVEVNRADYRTLLRVPGIGYKSASRIVKARRLGALGFQDLKKMGVGFETGSVFYYLSGEDDVSRQTGRGLYRKKSSGNKGKTAG